MGRCETPYARGSLGTAFLSPEQVHLVPDPSMLLGSLEVAEIIAMDWVRNDVAIFLKSLGFWRSDGALLIPTVGSPLIAMYYMQRMINSARRDLTKQEIGDFNLQDATSRHSIKELSNYYTNWN